MERYGGREQTFTGLLLVVVLHVAAGYALFTVLHRSMIDIVRPPMDARIIKELPRPPLEPPPLPPLRISGAPPVTVPMPEVSVSIPVEPVLAGVRVEKQSEVRPPAPVATIASAPPVRKEFKPAYRVDPIYPYAAQRQGLDGKVVARVHVTADGTVSQVEIVVSTSPLFAREVLRTLSQWRFKPESVGFIGEYSINFTLQE
jgi:protein TonB